MGLQREGNSTGVSARTVVRPWPPLCPSGPSSTVHRVGSGAQRNRRSRRRPVSGVLCLQPRPGEWWPEDRGACDRCAACLQWEENRWRLGAFRGKLWRPGSVCAHAVSVYTGLGQVQPTEATSEGLGPLQLLGPGCSTGKLAPIQGSLLTGKPSRQRALETGFSPRITP